MIMILVWGTIFNDFRLSRPPEQALLYYFLNYLLLHTHTISFGMIPYLLPLPSHLKNKMLS